jgi:tetratricopeptide (TPR) repeat protein
MKSLILLLIFVFLHTTNLFCQDKKKLDSLNFVYNNLNSDTSKIRFLGEEVAFVLYRNLPDSAITVSQKALDWAEKLNYDRGKAWAYNRLGLGYFQKSNYPIALEHTQKGLVLFEKVGVKNGIAISYNNIGIIYFEQANFKTALEYYLKALEKFEEIKNMKRGISVSYTNIGRTYTELGDYSLALEYHLRALKLNEEIKEALIISLSLTQIGKVYIKQKNYALGLSYLGKSLKIQEKTKDKPGIIQNLIALATIYYENKDYDLAISKASEALDLAKSINALIFVKESSLIIYQSHKENKNYEAALTYFELAKQMSDSIFNVDKAKSIANLESKVALEKKEQDFKLLEKNNEVNKLAAENNERQLLIAQKQSEANRLFAEANEEKSKRKADSLNALAQKTQLESDKLRAEDEQLKAENKASLLENQKNKKEQEIQTNFNYFISISFVLVLIFAVFIFNSRKKITIAFKNLADANVLIQQKKDEIETQSEELQQTNATLQTTLEFVNHQNVKIKSSVNYALKIQTAMLPIAAEFKTYFPESFILFRPKDIVSGDFYWLAEIEEAGQSFVMLIVADCTGHGVPGALVSMLGCNIFNNLVKEKHITEPEIILTELDKELRKTLQQDRNESKDGMDVAVVRLTKRQGNNETKTVFEQIDYAGAMNPLYFVINGKLEEIKGTKLGIGGGSNKDKKFERHTISLINHTTAEENSVNKIQIYLSSDGFQDQFGGEFGKKFMTKQFKELISQVSEEKMETQKEILETTLDNWINISHELQTDDITVLGICLNN